MITMAVGAAGTPTPRQGTPGTSVAPRNGNDYPTPQGYGPAQTPEYWATGPTFQYYSKTRNLGFGFKKVTDRAVSTSNPPVAAGRSFDDATLAARELARPRTTLSRGSGPGSAAVFQTADGAYYVARLKMPASNDPNATGLAGPGVDGAYSGRDGYERWDTLIDKFEINMRADGLRAVVGADGYWKIDDTAKHGLDAATYVRFPPSAGPSPTPPPPPRR